MLLTTALGILSPLFTQMNTLLLTELRRALGDLSAAWLSRTGWSPSARAWQSAHTQRSSRRGAFACAVSWYNGSL